MVSAMLILFVIVVLSEFPVLVIGQNTDESDLKSGLPVTSGVWIIGSKGYLEPRKSPDTLLNKTRDDVSADSISTAIELTSPPSVNREDERRQTNWKASTVFSVHRRFETGNTFSIVCLIIGSKILLCSCLVITHRPSRPSPLSQNNLRLLQNPLGNPSRLRPLATYYDSTTGSGFTVTPDGSGKVKGQERVQNSFNTSTTMPVSSITPPPPYSPLLRA